jgi:dihydroxyacetone kinase-like predicted kinase
VLREAQVVDAGALGLALFLRGGLAVFTGAALPDPDAVMRPTARTRRVIESAEFPRWCTEFLLAGPGLDRETVTVRLAPHGQSLEVVLLEGEEARPHFRVHLHTDDAEAAVAAGRDLGAVTGAKAEDMRRQRASFLASSGGPAEVTLAAVATGPGFRRVFESLPGVGVVLEAGANGDIGGGALRAGLAHAPGRAVIVLPNGERLVEPARAAAADCGKPARVIATATVAQGVAAALAFDEGAALDENARAMARAAASVRTLLVGRTGGGEPGAFARLDGRTIANGRNLVEAAAGAARVLEGEPELITIYYGAGASEAEADEVARRLEALFPGAESQVVHGGQPDWPLLIGLEGDGGQGRH